MTHRALGLVAILLSPLLATMPLPDILHWPHAQVIGALTGWLFLAGWLSSAVAMRRLRVLGQGQAAFWLSAVQVTLLLLASVQQVMDATVGRLDTWYYFVCDMAWPGSMVMMLVTGVAVWRARVWLGWRRYVPVLCGFALPAAALAGALLKGDAGNLTFSAYTCLLWAALGTAVLTNPAPVAPPRPAYAQA